MTNGIIKTEDGFSVKDFDEDRVVFSIGNPEFPSYMDAVEACRGKFYPPSYYPYLAKASELDKTPDTDVWENMIYAEDPRGVWDGEREVWRNVSSMDRGAATDEEIAYVDALDATYTSLMTMVTKG